jgi:hypothetical protein
MNSVNGCITTYDSTGKENVNKIVIIFYVVVKIITISILGGIKSPGILYFDVCRSNVICFFVRPKSNFRLFL